MKATGWRRPIGCLIFIGHLLQKSPIISASFAKNDMQLEASNGSSPPCIVPHGDFLRENSQKSTRNYGVHWSHAAHIRYAAHSSHLAHLLRVYVCMHVYIHGYGIYVQLTRKDRLNTVVCASSDDCVIHHTYTTHRRDSAQRFSAGENSQKSACY